MASARPDTNTLHVELPKGMTLQVARSAFSRFGDISNIELLAGAKHSARVVYYDVRAAAAAIAALGKNRCVPAPQTGCRLARLNGSVHLSSADIPLVSGVNTHPSEGGCFMVEFYDIRDAQRIQEMVTASKPSEAGQEDQTGLSSEAALPAPVYVQPLSSRPQHVIPGSSGAAAPKAAPEPKKAATGEVEVRLRGLPQALCSAPCMEAMLEQAGLDGKIVSCRVRRGAKGAEAIITLANKHSADLCVRHFNGRRWGEASLEVTACIDEPQATVGPPGLTAAAPAAKPKKSKGARAGVAGSKETSMVESAASTTDDSSSERSCAEGKLAALHPHLGAFVM